MEILLFFVIKYIVYVLWCFIGMQMKVLRDGNAFAMGLKRLIAGPALILLAMLVVGFLIQLDNNVSHFNIEESIDQYDIPKYSLPVLSWIGWYIIFVIGKNGKLSSERPIKILWITIGMFISVGLMLYLKELTHGMRLAC